MKYFMNQKRIPYYLIESFLMAAQKPSLQSAADELGITQSTLSKQMLMLEEFLPHSAFAFRGRKKVLTSFGNALYRSLLPKFSQTQEVIEQTALQFSKPENLHIKICGRGELLDMLALRLKFTGTATFVPMNNESALEAVIDRQAELAIVHTGRDSSEVIMKPFLLNDFKISISKTWLKSKPKSATELIGKIKYFPCLLYKAQDALIENIIKSWELTFDDLKVRRIYPNYATLARMVDEGQGWAILPSHIEIDSDRNHVFPVSVRAPFQRKFHICYRKEMAKVAWFKELIADIREFSGPSN